MILMSDIYAAWERSFDLRSEAAEKQLSGCHKRTRCLKHLAGWLMLSIIF